MAACALGAVLLCVLSSASTSALEVRVRAHTKLSVDVAAAGTMVRVSGTLRDELDHGLAQRKVRVFFAPEPSNDAYATGPEVVFTDRRGRFSTKRELKPGAWTVEARFARTEHLTSSRVAHVVDVQRAPTELSIQVPRHVVGSGTPAPVRVRASVAGVGLQARAQVFVDAVEAGSVMLDQFGRGTVDVAGELDAGRHQVLVQIAETEYREAVNARAPIRFSDQLRVTADFQQVIDRLQRGLAVRGEVVDSTGPIAGMRVEVRISRQGEAQSQSGEAVQRADAGRENRELRAGRRDRQAPYERFVTTDDSGSFDAFFDGDALEDGRWTAHTTVFPQRGPEISVPAQSIELDRATSRWILNALGVLALLGALVLVLQRLWKVIDTYLSRRRLERETQKRAEKAFRDTESLSPVSLLADQAPVDNAPSRTRISGVVWDVWKGRPVLGADISLTQGAGETHESQTSGAEADGRGGVFVIGDLGAGAYTLEIRAHGFMPARLEFRVPHSGKLSNMRLDLVAVPLKIRRLYQSVVERLQGTDLWGRLSPRQIEEAVLEAAKQAHDRARTPAARAFLETLQSRLAEQPDGLGAQELVAMMTTVVEETYFSGRQFDLSVWQLSRDIAVRLSRRFEEDSP